MIRALALFLGLFIGLAGAAVVGGTVAHVRLVAGDRLPGWMDALEGQSGFFEGTGQFRSAALRWGLVGFDTSGPHWQATWSGDDWQAQGTLRVGLGGIRVTGIQGLVLGAVLAEGGQGATSITDGEMALPQGEGWIEGRANGLALATGAEPVSGDVRLEASGGVWTFAQP